MNSFTIDGKTWRIGQRVQTPDGPGRVVAVLAAEGFILVGVSSGRRCFYCSSSLREIP